jgi:PKD repeat protein
LYRPVDLTPGTVVADTFGVRFYDHSPSVNGCNVNTKEAALCEVNSDFYHQVSKGHGSLTNAGIKMYFDSLVDGHYDAIAHWQVVPEWENTLTPVMNYQASPNLSTAGITGWTSFIPISFALAKTAPVVLITPVAAVCANAAPFNFNASPPGGTWSGPGITNPVTGAFDPAIAGAGTHSIQYSVVSINGCTSVATLIVTVNPVPVAGFTYLQNSNTVNFTNTSTNAITCHWDFNDGTTSTASSPSHTYGANGTYIVQLIAINACGNDTIYDTIQIVTTGIGNSAFGGMTISPNPFESQTVLEYTLRSESPVNIALFDLTGRLVRVFADVPLQPAGSYKLEIDDIQFDKVQGVFLLRVTIGNQASLLRLVHL